jgi:tetratricopeptide (TPR) repeat protein
VSTALVVRLFRTLPQFRPGDDPELWALALQDSLQEFRRALKANYNEGTLQRLLRSPDAEVRRAAVAGLGLIGTIDSNAAVAILLHDEDPTVRQAASDSLWEIWFRGGNDQQNQALLTLASSTDPNATIVGLSDLILRAPAFAEVYNQRAILHFRRGEFQKSIADCQKVLQLNPYHFGAQAGIGQCYLKMRKPRAALRAFRLALEINPGLEHLQSAIRALQEALGETEDEAERG